MHNCLHLAGRKLAAGKRQDAKGNFRDSLGGFIVDEDEEESADEVSSGSNPDSKDSSSEYEQKTASSVTGASSWADWAGDSCIEQKLLDELHTKGMQLASHTLLVQMNI